MVQGTCFESTVLCLSGFPQMVKAQIEAVCRLVQARHTLQLKRGRSTHLICARPDGPKYDKARKWKIPIVSLDWLFQSMRARKLRRPNDYSVHLVSENASE